MAVDEALLHSDHDGFTLRFYQWSEPTLSLGYFQQLADRSQHPASLSCPVVRRGSGGGAIIHDRELTYSLVAPISARWGSSAEQLYYLMHESLCELLVQWTVMPNLFTPPLHALGSPALPRAAEPFLCFLRRSAGDVELQGHKICGSAQRRHRQRILQHGSLLIERSAAAPELAGLHDLAPDVPDVAGITQAWLQSVVRRLHLKVAFGELTTSESKLIAQFEGKFHDPYWTAKR